MRLLLAALLFAAALPAAEKRVIGLTATGRPIEAGITIPKDPRHTLVVIGGMRGADATSQTAIMEAARIQQERRAFNVRVIVIPVANPDKAPLQFPPTGVAYRDNPVAHTLWRWIATQSADMVMIVGEDFGLADALSQSTVAGIGRIPAVQRSGDLGLIRDLPEGLNPSEATLEIQRRIARTPKQFAAELSKVYGNDFGQVTYIPGMALIGQMRLGNLDAVKALAEPYASGAKDPLGTRPSSLTLAGHLVFAELARRTHDPRYLALVRKAADLGFTPEGAMKVSMPFHDEMSDSVFMGTAIVAEAGKLTGEKRYFDMAARHLQFMEKLVLRSDGLYRHSPLNDAAWGRGNAFPSLGLALTLTDFPKDHAAYSGILASYRKLMAKLAPYQDPDGMWHEVIDEPGSYAETSATSMIAFAMLRGIHNGWLDAAEYQPRVDRAWKAVLARVSSNGELLDVCESTNKQPTAKDYLNRAASLGNDARGGAMALLLATEMANLK